MPSLTAWASFCAHVDNVIPVIKTITWLLLSRLQGNKPHRNFPEPSEPYLLNLRQHTPEPSEIFRNLPELASGTCAILHRNSPEPSGTCLRNLHQHTPELSGTCSCDPHRHTPELIWRPHELTLLGKNHKSIVKHLKHTHVLLWMSTGLPKSLSFKAYLLSSMAQ